MASNSLMTYNEATNLRNGGSFNWALGYYPLLGVANQNACLTWGQYRQFIRTLNRTTNPPDSRYITQAEAIANADPIPVFINTDTNGATITVVTYNAQGQTVSSGGITPGQTLTLSDPTITQVGFTSGGRYGSTIVPTQRYRTHAAYVNLSTNTVQSYIY